MGPVSISPLKEGNGVSPSKRKVQVIKAARGPWKIRSFFIWGRDEKWGGLLSGFSLRGVVVG